MAYISIIDHIKIHLSPADFTGLNATTRLECKVLVLHRSHVPPFGHVIIFQLEGLVIGNLLLIRSYVNA
jgi:hypothetical protein